MIDSGKNNISGGKGNAILLHNNRRGSSLVLWNTTEEGERLENDNIDVP